MKKFTALVLLILSISCNKDLIVKDIFISFDIKSRSLPADGSTTTIVSVELPVDSDPAKRGVIFSAINGIIPGAQQGKLIVKAEYENGKLIAKANFKASYKPGKAFVTVSPEVQTPYKDFKIVDSITLTQSLPSQIKLEISAPAVRINYQNEIFIKGTLFNQQNKGVSEGVQVLFEDYYFISGLPVNGRYRNRGNATADSSSVSAFFSSGNSPANTDFYIKVTVLDNGVKTNIKDSLLLTLIN